MKRTADIISVTDLGLVQAFFSSWVPLLFFSIFCDFLFMRHHRMRRLVLILRQHLVNLWFNRFIRKVSLISSPVLSKFKYCSVWRPSLQIIILRVARSITILVPIQITLCRITCGSELPTGKVSAMLQLSHALIPPFSLPMDFQYRSINPRVSLSAANCSHLPCAVVQTAIYGVHRFIVFPSFVTLMPHNAFSYGHLSKCTEAFVLKIECSEDLISRK